MRGVTELEELAGSVIVCGFEGTEPPRSVRSWLADRSVAGLILFKRNIDDVQQTAELITSCTSTHDPDLPILVCVDQEGGRVARFGEPIVQLPPMRVLADAGDPELTASAARLLGQQLRAVGVNLDFAPVLDVDTNPDNPVIGDRAFGDDPDVVIEHALAFARGLQSGGVLSCGKHFPGHGDTDLDSHFALPTLRHARKRLEEVEFAPFRAAVGNLPSIMTAHVVFEAIDNVPATFSAKAIDGILRSEIGYAGAVFTDDLEMKAASIRYSIEEAGLRAIEAGCDILLVCSDVDATGRLREALAREAGQRESFREKLTAARARADTLRRKASAVAKAPGQSALRDESVSSLRQRLAQLR